METQRKLKAAEIGYFGKGVPTSRRDGKAAVNIRNQAFEGGVRRSRGARKMGTYAGPSNKSDASNKVDEKALIEAMELATELLPIHFKVDDIEWIV